MGAALQRYSQNWVVGGDQLHGSGRGLSRDASIQLAESLQNMAGDSSFKKQTGGMFTSHDLMNITQGAGRAGLLDMAQTVPEIQKKVRQTASTIKEFMAITQDPDVSNVIREMGNLRQMGMSQQDMLNAAQGMKTYSRMAGTSIQGLKQMGGLPGAAVFQGVGMTAATGFDYGNFAAANARQYAASGNVSARELALMGGVSGITQREIQAQAAMAGMPLYGAANAQFSGGQWNLNQSMVGRSQGGAAGMVNSALAAANQGVAQGGLGALAMLPFQQKEVSDLAMRNMSPEQAMAQRFAMVQQTQEMMGLEGTAGFGATAQMMFGADVGGQMFRQAKNPQFWSQQLRQVQRRRSRLAQEQELERLSKRGFFEKAGDVVGFGGLGKSMDQADVSRGLWMAALGPTAGRQMDDADISGTLGRGLSRAWDTVSNNVSDLMLDENTIRRRIGRGATIDSQAERNALRGFVGTEDMFGSTDYTGARSVSAMSLGRLGRSLSLEDQGLSGTWAEAGGGVFSAAASVGLRFPGTYGGKGLAEGAQGLFDLATRGGDEAFATMQAADIKRSRTVKALRSANRFTGEDQDKLAESLTGKLGEKGANDVLMGIGSQLSGRLNKSGRMGFWDSMFSGEEWKRQMGAFAKGDIASAFTMTGSKSLTAAEMQQQVKDIFVKKHGIEKWNKLSDEDKRNLTSHAWNRAGKLDSGVQGFMGDTLGDYKKDLAGSMEDASLQKAERDREVMAGIEESLGMTSGPASSNRSALGNFLDPLGIFDDKEGLNSLMQAGKNVTDPFGIFSSDKVGAQELREQMQGQSVTDTMMLAAVGGGDKTNREEAFKMWQRLGGKGGRSGFRKAWSAAEDKFGGLGSDLQDRYRGMGGNFQDAARMAYKNKKDTRTEALRTFASQYSDYVDSGALADITNRVGDIRGEDVAGAFTKESLHQMVREGKVKEARLINRAQKGDQSAIDTLERMAVEQQVGGDKVEESKKDATGKEADKLQKTEDALKNLAAMFEDMQPAIKDFRSASKDFRDAVEADAFQNAIED